MMDRKKHKTDDSDSIEATPEGQVEEDALAVEDTEESKLLEKIVQENEQAAKERDEYLDLLQRSRAEFDNYRRRNQNAREDAYNEGVRNTISMFLPVLDNLERAVDAPGGEEALREGVQLVLKQFNAVLSKAGVEEIEAGDCDFDPNLHHAVMQEETDAMESGKVAGVLQKGYRMGDRVLRHCMVKVVK